MNAELRELYQEVILDHNKRPRNKGILEAPSARADGYNPLCGDTVSLTLVLEGDWVKDILFEGVGCAISTASASMMTEAVKGKRIDEALELVSAFQTLVTGGEASSELGDLELLGGVREHPSRVKCATLPWHTLRAALQGDNAATTEAGNA